MTHNDSSDEDNEWGKLYNDIRRVMEKHGREDYRGRADYLIVDDDYGLRQQKVEVHNLGMLEPQIVKSLQKTLGRFPEWEIIVSVSIPGTEGVWPPMGLTLRADRISDDLRREFLPEQFRNLRYLG